MATRPFTAAMAALVFTVGVGVAGPASAQEPKTVIFTGLDTAPGNTVGTWAGAIYAFNGLGSNSLFVRALGAHAWYEYTSGAVGSVSGQASLADALIGYQFVQSNVRVALSAGVEVQDYRLSPDDPGNRIRGAATGLKVMGDIGTLNAKPWFFDLIGSYSTAFDSYWSRGRVGYAVHKVVIGPETTFYGNSDFRAQRFGGFLQFDMPVNQVYTRTSIGIGHESTGGGGVLGGREGLYTTLNLSFAF